MAHHEVSCYLVDIKYHRRATLVNAKILNQTSVQEKNKDETLN